METQEESARRLAQAEGFNVAPENVFREMESGVYMERSVLQALRRSAELGKINGVFVHTPDRLSREPVDLLMLIAEFDARGAPVKFVEGVSGTSPEAMLMQFVAGWAGQRERLMFRERSMRGRRKVAELGRPPVGMHNTYGYNYDPATKVRTIIEEEANVIRRMFRMIADGVSAYRTAKTLNEEGLRTRAGKLWTASKVLDIIRRSSYIGIDVFGKERTQRLPGNKRKVEPRPEDEWVKIEGFSPRIVSDAVHKQANEKAGVRHMAKVNHGRRPYELTGYASCASCGFAVVGAGARHHYRYYHCNGARTTEDSPRLCAERVIKADALEALVWDVVAELVSDPSGAIEQLLGTVEGADAQVDAEMGRLRSEAKRCEREEMRLLEAYRTGIVKMEYFQAQMAPLVALRERCEEQMSQLENQRAVVESGAEAERMIRKYCAELEGKLEDLDFDGKRALFSALGLEVIAGGEGVSITVVLDPGFLTTSATS